MSGPVSAKSNIRCYLKGSSSFKESGYSACESSFFGVRLSAYSNARYIISLLRSVGVRRASS